MLFLALCVLAVALILVVLSRKPTAPVASPGVEQFDPEIEVSRFRQYLAMQQARRINPTVRENDALWAGQAD